MRLLSAVIAFLAFLVVSCSDLTPSSGESAPGEKPEQELYTATVNFYQDERLSSILQAGRIRKYTKQTTVLLDSGVVIDFFDSRGEHTTTLWSDSGRVDESRKDLVAIGHVVAKSDSGQILETDRLRWDNRTRKIISDGPVKLSTPTDTLYGTGFVSDEHLKNWQIERPTGLTFRELQKREQSAGQMGDSIRGDTALHLD